MSTKKWKQSEVEYIKQNIDKMSRREIANHLGVSKEQLKSKIRYIDDKSESKYWTPEEHQFLIDNYNKLSRKELAQALGVSVSAISNKAFRLGLISQDNSHCSGFCQKCNRKFCIYSNRKIEFIKSGKVWSEDEMKEILWKNHTYWERIKFMEIFQVTSEELDELYDKVLHEHGLCIECDSVKEQEDGKVF